jgi:TRAP-type transport system periplasmic protein
MASIERGREMHTQRKAHLVAAGLAAVLTTTSTACAVSNTDKAGGTDRTAPVVLTFATNQPWIPTQLEAYPAEVERLSGGSVRIEVKSNWRSGEPQQEVGTIEDLQAGKIDIAWVGARAFDFVGVTSFQALVAPFLIDSYDLEGKVFDAGIPGRMLQSLDTIGLTGIGIVPGPLRKMTGVTGPFVEPGDFAKKVVGTSGGALAEETFRALGATPKMVPSGTTLNGLDGIDFQLGAVEGNDFAAFVESVTANIDLWPRPLVVVMNGHRFAGLTDKQQQMLRTAAANVSKAALDASRAEDAQAASGLCTLRVKIVEASATDLAALRAATEPVYATLRDDSTTQTYLDEIEALKVEVVAAPESFKCSPTATSAGGLATPFDGVYQFTTSEEDLRAARDPNPIPQNYGAWTFVFDRGLFAFTQEAGDVCTWGYGTYVVKGDRVEISFLDGGGINTNHAQNRPGEFFVFGWSLYRDVLTLTAVPGEVSPTVYSVKPWHRLDASPSASALNQRPPRRPDVSAEPISGGRSISAVSEGLHQACWLRVECHSGERWPEIEGLPGCTSVHSGARSDASNQRGRAPARPHTHRRRSTT